MKTKLRNIYIELWKVLNFFWKNLKNCSKITKKSLFFPLFGKKSFLNRTLGLRKSFLNQTTYVLKNWLHQQSFLNQDSFLNQAFLNQDSTVIVFLADYNFTLYGDQPEFFMYKFPERATTYKVNSGGWALYTEPNFQGKVMYHLGSKFSLLFLNFKW